MAAIFLGIMYLDIFLRKQIIMSTVEYNVPLKYRKMENLHIVFWLFKDISWCMIWKPLGIAMIFPTLIIAIIISYRTRAMVSELCHNLAIVVWIAANSYWMITEFLGIDEDIAFGNVSYKHVSIVPFTIGILILAFYYLIWKPRNKNLIETM